MIIRNEQRSDIEAIHVVHKRAFDGTYEPGIVDKIRIAGRVALSLVAVEDDVIVGHVLFSPVTFNPSRSPGKWVALGPIGVLPHRQGRGIGSRLVLQDVEECNSLGYHGIVLLGNPDYYRRFGFVRASEQGLTSEFGSGPAFQAMGLKSCALAEVGGLAIYQSEFTER